MIYQIQFLRFFAAMWVVVYHAQDWPQLPQTNDFVRVFFSWGFMGVDIFFVISGCIMALMLHQNRRVTQSALHFSLVRLARIYTGWWPIFVLYGVWFSYLGQLGPEIDLFSSFFLLLAPPQSLLTAVLWTLTFELYFYVLIGVLKMINEFQRGRIVAVLALGVALYAAYMTSQQRFEPENIMRSTSLMHFWVSPLLLEFFGGFLVFRHVVKNSRQDWKPWLAGCYDVIRC